MLEQYGPIDTLSRLVVSADLQKGFQVLAEKGQLEDSFEALVVRFGNLFKPEVVEAAQWRLDHPDELLGRTR
jgi:hypothetical protein